MTESDVSQYKASQQLLNPNKALNYYPKGYTKTKMAPKEKHVRMELSRIQDFINPKADREQYMTSIEVAIQWLNLVNTEIGIEGKIVADLGCGTGMLSCGLLVFGAKQVYGFEVDSDALEQATESIDDEDLFIPVNVDVEKIDIEKYPKFDIVLSNPPFGTKENPHIDFAFIDKGCKLLAPGGVLYTLHKTSCVDAVIKKGISQIQRVSASKDAKIKWELLNTYRHHKKKSVDIDVTLVSWHISSS
uniref:Methyltransferase small domain-containing protein n=1 Tax=Panagrolaimus sp. PS1159 TaxID=55785 RepID=A0AC35F824_9BILA